MVLENFIVFEGIDGAGTSTQLKIIEERPESAGFVLSAEPTKGPVGVFLRQMLSGKIPLDPRTAAYLFAADRNEHLYSTNGIVSQLKKGKIAISDRYLFSSLAYQSIDCGRELPFSLNKEFPLPQYLFFFDIEPEISLQRIQKRDVIEIYEKLDFLKKTVTAYRAVMSEYSHMNTGMQIIRLDASESIEKTSQIIWSYIERLPILKA